MRPLAPLLGLALAAPAAGHVRGLVLRVVRVVGPGRRPLHVEHVVGLRADGLAPSSD